MCPHCQAPGKSTIRKGFFTRRERRVQRYQCKACQRFFSDQTTAITYREKKPQVNQAVMRLRGRGVSQRKIARQLGIHPRTVARKIVRLTRAARQRQERHLAQRPPEKTTVAACQAIRNSRRMAGP